MHSSIQIKLHLKKMESLEYNLGKVFFLKKCFYFIFFRNKKFIKFFIKGLVENFIVTKTY